MYVLSGEPRQNPQELSDKIKWNNQIIKNVFCLVFQLWRVRKPFSPTANPLLHNFNPHYHNLKAYKYMYADTLYGTGSAGSSLWGRTTQVN